MSVIGQLNLLPFVANRRKNGCSYKVISAELQLIFPTIDRGLSARSVKRFSWVNDLHATSRLSDQALDTLVSSSIGMVRNILSDVWNACNIEYLLQVIMTVQS